MPKFYLTTAIDYSNGDPHLGHALEKVGADCIARYRRLRGDAVHFLMGMDEHSQSVIQAAARAGVTPQAWVDRMAASFADYWRRLHCSHDDWIRTARACRASVVRIQSSCEQWRRRADRRRALRRASHPRADPDQGAEPLLPAERVPRRRARSHPLGRAERAARDPPQRGAAPRR